MDESFMMRVEAQMWRICEDGLYDLVLLRII